MPLILSSSVSHPIFEPLNISTLPAYLPVDDTPPTLHPWEVYKELKAIKSSKVSGPDGIPPKLIIKSLLMNLVAPSQMCLIVLSEKGLYLINGNLLLLFPSLKQYPPSVDKMRPISLTDTTFFR